MEYFVLRAPRQTGKTSTLLALAKRLNASGEYRCVYMNVETGQSAREDVGRAIAAVLSEMDSRAREMVQDDSVNTIWSTIPETTGPDSALKEVLVRWSLADRKPLILLIDEIDSLIGDSLISVLRQLRSAYDRRPRRFPQSIILCGVRDVRDYRIRSSRENAVVLGGSAFNIKCESLRLGDFSEDEVRKLLGQHEAQTGQAFTEAARARIWQLTCGQPWLVNALAYHACFKDKAGRDRTRPIDAYAIDSAKEALILDRVTHLDQLADKLREDRVRRVIEPLLASSDVAVDLPQDDIEYVSDLGLVRVDGTCRIANPIYAEVVPRELTYSTERTLAQRTVWYVRPDGSLDVWALLKAFQEYFRRNGEHWTERFAYREAGPQLLLQAFLQRVVNAGGRIEREYALGRGRVDLLVRWPVRRRRDPTQAHKHAIECKVLGEGRGLERLVNEGLRQTAAYMDRCGAESGHLVVFDRRAGKSWDERLFRREQEFEDKEITVWGM